MGSRRKVVLPLKCKPSASSLLTALHDHFVAAVLKSGRHLLVDGKQFGLAHVIWDGAVNGGVDKSLKGTIDVELLVDDLWCVRRMEIKLGNMWREWKKRHVRDIRSSYKKLTGVS